MTVTVIEEWNEKGEKKHVTTPYDHKTIILGRSWQETRTRRDVRSIKQPMHKREYTYITWIKSLSISVKWDGGTMNISSRN
jgi:hypothetical protein